MSRNEQLWALANLSLASVAMAVAAPWLVMGGLGALLAIVYAVRWMDIWFTPPKRREVTVYFSDDRGRVPYVIADDDIDVKVRELGRQGNALPDTAAGSALGNASCLPQ